MAGSAAIPGGGEILPSVVTNVTTQTSGASIPGGIRVAALIGLGSRSEIMVSSAVGDGNDGLDPTYSSSAGSDGRHFVLQNYPIISNRTTLYKNGIPLTGLEDPPVDGESFSALYDYRIDIETGQIELQQASLVDQGGSFYSKSIGTANTGGDGYLSNDSLGATFGSAALIDANAPTETWTIKCISVQYSSGGVRIKSTARFVAFGSVSGNILDANGNPIVWVADGTVSGNTILSFAIWDTSSASLREGDYFTVRVNGGSLKKNDSLTVTYIAETDLNDPVFFDNTQAIAAKHGAASLDNTLSLGAQIAFANVTPGVMTVQARPALPRRTSYELSASISTAANPATLTVDDFILPLPVGVQPGTDTTIHFFFTNPTTRVETQVLPNKLAFFTYELGTDDVAIEAFIKDQDLLPAGNAFSYTVVTGSSVLNAGNDGYLDGDTNTFSVSGVTFTTAYVGRSVKIVDSANGNDGTFVVANVVSGNLVLTGSFTSETSLQFEVIDSSATSNYVVVNYKVVPGTNYSLRATIVDTKDESFYDAGWVNAIASLESQEVDMVVPLPKQTISAIFQNTLSHCKVMSDALNKKERILMCGAINGLTPDNLTGTTSAAVEDIGVLEGLQGDSPNEILDGNTEDLTNYSVPDAFGNTYRCVYFFPDQIVVQVGSDNQIIDGFYVAAAAAGYLSGSINIEVPLTRKILTGFTILRNRLYSNRVLRQLATAGVCCVQPVAGGGRVTWGITTSQSGFVEEEEISIIFIRDRIAKNFRAGLDGFIGQPDATDTIPTISTRAIKLLQGFASQRLITDWRDLTVKRDSAVPTQFNVTVRVQPTYSINWIYVQVGVGLLS